MDEFMRAAIDEARAGYAEGGIPIGSVIVHAGRYTTLSPCAMCSGAILLYGIPRVIVGENRSFMGEEALLRSRGVELTVLDDPECIELMARLMREKTALWSEDIGE